MGLDTAFSIASGGLANISSQLGVVSQNVANANTSGYTKEVGVQTAEDSDGEAMGVRTGVTQRSVDTALQNESRQQNATVAALTVRSDALSAIDSANGSTSDSNDLTSLTESLSDAFTSLDADPSSTTEQAAVVTAAKSLVSGIHRIADAITTQRQAAQDSLVDEVSSLNSALTSIGSLTSQILTAQKEGESTATLEDQRDSAEETVTELTGASYTTDSNGSVEVILPSGTTLPTDGSATLQISDATISATSTAPAIELVSSTGSGSTEDITDKFTAGQIGANVDLRDTELPTMQAELDEFSHDLADRFSSSGLELFTDGSGKAVAAASTAGAVQSGYVGLSSTIEVNPTVASDSALVQQGTSGTSIATSSQSVISSVLSGVFGTTSSASTPATTGLGASGTLSMPFSAPSTLEEFATAIVSAQTGASSSASSDLSAATTVQTTLTTKVAAVSGVSVDSEMSTMISLQNSYAANARMITTIQSLWNTLDNMGT